MPHRGRGFWCRLFPVGAVGLLTVAILVVPVTAFAYVDPLTGSVLLQVLAAGLLGALFMAKTVWRRVTRVVRRLWARRPGR